MARVFLCALATELRIGTALLEEDGHYLEGILCQGLLRAEKPRREQQDIETERKAVRDKRRIHQWLRVGRHPSQHAREHAGCLSDRQWQPKPQGRM